MQAMQTMSISNGATSVVGNGPSASRGERPDHDMTPLIQLITASIAPGTWRVYDPKTNSDVSAAYGMGGGFGGGDAGGLDTANPIGSITPFFLSISLIIRHTAEIHDQVADLLRQLRRLQDLQVSIEVRFITLNDSFFESISVDFDFDIRSKSVGKKSTFAFPNPAQQVVPIAGHPRLAQTTTTGTSTAGGQRHRRHDRRRHGRQHDQRRPGRQHGEPGRLVRRHRRYRRRHHRRRRQHGRRRPKPGLHRQPVPRLHAGQPAAGHRRHQRRRASATSPPTWSIPFQQGPYQSLIQPSNASTSNAGATFGISFLSDLEVYLFLTAAQGDTRTNVLQAPKVTTFNGAPAFHHQSPGDQLRRSRCCRSSAPARWPSSRRSGRSPTASSSQVTPVVSADRRYVRMTLSPTFTVLNNFFTISVPAAVGGSGLGGTGAPISGSIQLPNFSLTTVSTTVTVPDGGTVLLGGVKRLSEERKEFGVPVLSKIPMLNRLFRNIGIGRQTSSLMLMVTPRIIILEEEEERLGIPTVAQ